jgi:hypothetical protein
LGSGSLPVRILLFPARLLWSILEFLMLLVIVTLIWAFMLTAGFGLKPRRVTGTVAVTILLFSGLYFANDTTAGRCSDVSWMEAGKSLYSAIANLTSLGGAPPHCGPYTGSIASIETLAGYFLLSILAAMFFVWLRDH